MLYNRRGLQFEQALLAHVPFQYLRAYLQSLTKQTYTCQRPRTVSSRVQRLLVYLGTRSQHKYSEPPLNQTPSLQASLYDEHCMLSQIVK